MLKQERFNTFFMQISQNVYFQVFKMTFGDLIPYMIALSVMYLCQLFFKELSIKNFLLIGASLYSLFIPILYTYHYAKLKNASLHVYMLFSFILSFLFHKDQTVVQSLLLTLPVLCLNVIGLIIIEKLLLISFHFSFFPKSVLQYIWQCLIMFFSLLMICFFWYYQRSYIPYLQMIFEYFMIFFSSIWGIVMIIAVTCYFWVSGIHGVAIIGTLLRPFWLQMFIINFVYVVQGQSALYIGVEGFFQWFVWLGGSGATLGLVILCRYFARSQHLKSLGKEAIVSGFFNINEQVIFGLPIIEGRYLKIPFFAVPLIQAVLTYYLMSIGVIQIPFLMAPWVFPFFMGSTMATTQIPLILYGIFEMSLSMLIYFPFFYMYDHHLKIQEDSL